MLTYYRILDIRQVPMIEEVRVKLKRHQHNFNSNDIGGVISD